jgi:hypothetical protein
MTPKLHKQLQIELVNGTKVSLHESLILKTFAIGLNDASNSVVNTLNRTQFNTYNTFLVTILKSFTNFLNVQALKWTYTRVDVSSLYSERDH